MVMSRKLVEHIKHSFDEHNFKGERTMWFKIKNWLIETHYDIWCRWNTINPLHIFRRMKRHGILLKNFRLTIKTLEPVWQDSDNQILHANFQILTNFVEEECSYMSNSLDIESARNVKDKKEKGILYLKEYINNPDIDDKRDITWSEGCKQILDLYVWWSKSRPARKDPHDLMIKHNEINDLLFDYWGTSIKERKQFAKDHPEFMKNYTAWSKSCEKVRKLEEKYDLEDEEMLLKLIKIRKYMWT